MMMMTVEQFSHASPACFICSELGDDTVPYASPARARSHALCLCALLPTGISPASSLVQVCPRNASFVGSITSTQHMSLVVHLFCRRSVGLLLY
jgi:hypothetical protein